MFRPQDTIARIGGDELAILVEGDEDPGALISRARAAVETPIIIRVDSVDHPVRVGVSVGHAHADDSCSKETLLGLADAAKYRDKRRRNSDAVR
jgi:diguanylate cyclase